MYFRYLLLFQLYIVVILFTFFFFKQKTAYEMRISDWSSDVCSSDLQPVPPIWATLRRFLIYLWPTDAPALRRRVIYALLLVLLGKATNLEIGRASCRERVCQYV